MTLQDEYSFFLNYDKRWDCYPQVWIRSRESDCVFIHTVCSTTKRDMDEALSKTTEQVFKNTCYSKKEILKFTDSILKELYKYVNLNLECISEGDINPMEPLDDLVSKQFTNLTLKPMVGEIPGDVLLGVGRIFSFGANKHGKGNWLKEGKQTPKQHLASALRHIYSYQSDDKIDDESGESHLLHAACRLIMAAKMEIDDAKS